MKPEQIRTAVRSLSQDPRFAGLVAWIDRYHASWTTTASNQSLADSHGRLAHAAGSLHALEILRTGLKAIVDGRKAEETAPPG